MAASLRPRRYYRVPKETLETFLDDVEQLINFFVIEFQRILFAENVTVTVGVSPHFPALFDFPPSIPIISDPYKTSTYVIFRNLGLPHSIFLILPRQVPAALGPHPLIHMHSLPRTLDLPTE